MSGTAQSGTISNWAMSLNNLIDDPSLTPPTIENAYNNTYGIVPNEWTKVASLPSRATDMIKGSSFTTTYAVYTSSFQYAGTYNGQVKYMLVHPSYKPAVYFMQDVASWKGFLDMEESVQATDKRDGKSYWVTKLKDGNVWMTQNLDFDINSNTTLDSTTTDLNVIYNSSTEQYAEYNDGYTESNDIIYWQPVSSATTINFQNTGPITGWQNSNTAPYSANKTDSAETGHFSLGNWYNWAAAIASNDSSAFDAQQANANNSICPKGWRLPNAGSVEGGYEFSKLLYTYGITNNATNGYGYASGGFNKIISSPLYFIRSGEVDNNNLGYLGTNGEYWSNHSDRSDIAFRLLFTSSNVWPASNDSHNGNFRKYMGMSVRCLAR